MSVLKVGALRSPSASSNNIVLNADGTISSGDGGAIPSNNYITGTFSSNNYITGTFVSNNYFEEEKVTLGSFVDISDYDLSSLGGSLIHASATGGIGGNTYSIPSTASAVYIWAQGAGGTSGTARSTDVNSSNAAGNGGGGSKVCTKISITHQPHSTLTDLYCEFNPQGEAVVYIGTSNSGVEIARGYKGNSGESISTGATNVYGDGGDQQDSVSGVSIASSSTSSYTQTTITDEVAEGTLSKSFPRFLGPYLEHGASGKRSYDYTDSQGYSGAGLLSEGLRGTPSVLGPDPSDSRDGINAHTIPWAFGVGAVGPFSVDMDGGGSPSTRPAAAGGYACVVIIVR